MTISTSIAAAFHDGFKVIDLEPQEHAVAVGLIVTVADGPVMVFDLEPVQLQNDLAIGGQLLIGGAPVRDARGNHATVGTREHANGTHFVQTYADRVWTDNLLALPECA